MFFESLLAFRLILSMIVLNMSTTQTALHILFGSKTRADLITLFVTHPNESFYVRQLAKRICQSTTPVVRELKKLENLGLVTSETKANARYYLLNISSPIYPELQSLVLKTTGIGDILKKYLHPFSSLLFAFIYGSFTTAEAGPKSDIDLFLIGQIPANVLAKTIKEAEKQLGRELQYSLFDKKEFLKKSKEGNDFIGQIIKGPKIMLIGDENEFKRFAKTGMD